MSTLSGQTASAHATGDTLLEARFDKRIGGHGRWIVSLILVFSVVGIPLIPLWLIFSFWYYTEYLKRISTRLTTRAIEIRQGVIFRKEATIPLNMITDVRLHDGPVMRLFGLRGLRIETAGQTGQNATSEGDLMGVIDAAAFRDAILVQRAKLQDIPQPSTADGIDTATVLIEIRDLLAKIEARQG